MPLLEEAPSFSSCWEQWLPSAHSSLPGTALPEGSCRPQEGSPHPTPAGHSRTRLPGPRLTKGQVQHQSSASRLLGPCRECGSAELFRLPSLRNPTAPVPLTSQWLLLRILLTTFLHHHFKEISFQAVTPVMSSFVILKILLTILSKCFT